MLDPANVDLPIPRRSTLGWLSMPQLSSRGITIIRYKKAGTGKAQSQHSDIVIIKA